jgi:hypothetical protein
MIHASCQIGRRHTLGFSWFISLLSPRECDAVFFSTSLTHSNNAGALRAADKKEGRKKPE